MSSLDVTVTVETPVNDIKFVNQDRNCKAVDEITGEVCGETESLRILDEFQKLYETRIENVDRDLDGQFERLSMKLQIMREWIRDLGEQNVMLVRTIEELEQAAHGRVKVLEEKLRHSSMLVSDDMERSNSTEDSIRRLSNRVSELEKEEENMQGKIEYLQSDITGLLELIRRGRQENDWNLEGIQFFQIQPNDIPVPLHCACDQEETNKELVRKLKFQVEQSEQRERTTIEYRAQLEEKLNDLTRKLYGNETIGNNYHLKTDTLLNEQVQCSSIEPTDDREWSNIALMADIAENMLNEKDLEMKSLKRQLQDAESKLVSLLTEAKLDVNNLNDQVKEKSNEIQSLRNQLAELKERYRYASLEIDLKEEIIKEMRKILKRETIKDPMVSYLTKTMLLMEKELETLYDLKVELQKLLEKIRFKEKQESGYDVANLYSKLKDIEILLQNCIPHVTNKPECAEDSKICTAFIESQLNSLQKVITECHTDKYKFDKNAVARKLAENVESIEKLCLEKERAIAIINSMIKIDNNNCICSETVNIKETSFRSCNERMCSWKSKADDLQDQVRVLERESKCKANVIDMLRTNIDSMEEELCAVHANAKDNRRHHTVDGIGLKKKIIELENTSLPQLFKTLENSTQSTKNGLQDLKDEVKKHAVSTQYIDKLENYETELDNCFQEIEKLKTALYNKDELLKNMDKINSIQSNSILMMQTEVKELHEELQEKINNQDQVISQYEKEKRELLKQNELQIQTIGHLQNAVVDAKRYIDQMGYKTVSDLQEKDEAIRVLKIYVDETQTQYNDCFAEAAEQDNLLDLQRDTINHLQEKIRHTEHGTSLIKQVEARVNDFQALKDKIIALEQSKQSLQTEYRYAVRSGQKAEEELQKLRKENKELKRDGIFHSNECTDKQFENLSRQHELQSEIDSLVQENDDLKRQLQIWKIDFDIIYKELQIEKDKQIEINRLRNEITCNEDTIMEQAKMIKKLHEQSELHESDLNEAKEALFVQRNRLQSLTAMLKDSLDNMVKLQVDYEVLKNDNSILKAGTNDVINRRKEDFYQLKEKLAELESKLCVTEDNYQRASKDFDKAQDQLIKLAKREADLQETLTNMQKEYSLKLMNAEEQKIILCEQLEDVGRKYALKNVDYYKLKDAYVKRIDAAVQQHITKENEKIVQMEESNRCLVQQLKDCIEEKALVEECNCDILQRSKEMHESLLELRKECQLQNKSLACMSEELTQTALSRSELCNESECLVSSIRMWMEEQRKYVEILAAKLKTRQQQVSQLVFEKKALLTIVRELKRNNNLLTQRTKRIRKPGRCVKSGCTRFYPARNTHTLLNSYCLGSRKKYYIRPMKTGHRTTVSGNSYWFPKMECVINELRKNNSWYNAHFCGGRNGQTTLEECRDYGYQSSTSK